MKNETTIKLVLDKAIYDNVYWKKDKQRNGNNNDVDWGLGLIPKDGGDEGSVYTYNASMCTCKDHLNDSLANYIAGTTPQYGTGGYRSDTTIPEDHFYITLRSTRLLDIQEGIKKFINPMEIAAGIEPTMCYQSDHPMYMLLQADRQLFDDGFLLNTWYMLIRTMFFSKSYDASTLEEFVMAHKEAGHKDSNYLKEILSVMEPSYFQTLFSMTEEFVMGRKEYKKLLKSTRKHVHEELGAMQLVLALSNPTARRTLSTTTLIYLGDRIHMLTNGLPWKKGHHYVRLDPPKPVADQRPKQPPDEFLINHYTGIIDDQVAMGITTGWPRERLAELQGAIEVARATATEEEQQRAREAQIEWALRQMQPMRQPQAQEQLALGLANPRAEGAPNEDPTHGGRAVARDEAQIPIPVNGFRPGAAVPVGVNPAPARPARTTAQRNRDMRRARERARNVGTRGIF